MSVFSIGMMSATKTKSKKTKESALEIIHDGVVMTKLAQSLSIPPKKITTSTENKSAMGHSKKELSENPLKLEKQYYVVADGVVFM